MKRTLLAAAALLPGLALGGALGGCGSQTRTVSLAGAPPASVAATGGGQPTTVTGSTSTATSPSQGATAPTSTHSAPEPAFTEHEAASESAGAAEAVVRARGYTPDNPAEYHSDQALRVLVGTRTGSGDGYGQLAFFFVNGRYIGTDTKEPSASVRVLSQGDTEVTLAYPLYRSSDPLCCPGGGQATVRFQLNDGQLEALDPIPPANSKSALSRY